MLMRAARRNKATVLPVQPSDGTECLYYVTVMARPLGIRQH